MRRIILVLGVGVVFGLSLWAQRAEAQAFRIPHRVAPAPIRPPIAGAGFNPFFGSSLTTARPPFVAPRFNQFSGTTSPGLQANPFVARQFPAFAPRFPITPISAFQTPLGVVAPSFPGTFNRQTGAFRPSLTGGSSVLTSRGVFMPTNGSFVASPFGNLALSTRYAFNPYSNRFVQSATGPYVFSTPGNLISSATGSPVPVSYFGLGRVNPLNPISPFNPFNQARRATLTGAYSALQNGYASTANPYGYNNPYSPAIYSSYMSAYSSPYGYGAGSGGGYGAGYGGGYGGGYGSGYSSGSNANTRVANQTASIPPYTPYDAPKQKDPILGAFGVPNENGAIQWPLAFRLMPPNQKRDLLDKFEGQLQIVASQGTSGKASPVVLNEARRSLDELQHWLNARRSDLAAGTYRDANTLLQNLGKTLRTMSY